MNRAGCILPVVLAVQNAVSVRCVTAIRSDVVELMGGELLLLFGRVWVIESGVVVWDCRGVSMILDPAPSPGICLSPPDR